VNSHMLVISRFLGIVVLILCGELHLPHIHAEYRGTVPLQQTLMPDLSGRWVLNSAKSEPKQGLRPSVEYRINQSGNRIELIVYVSGRRSRFQYVADGKETGAAPSSTLAGEAVARTYWENTTLVVESRQYIPDDRALTVNLRRYSLSPDGKTLMVRSRTLVGGNLRSERLLVFDRR